MTCFSAGKNGWNPVPQPRPKSALTPFDEFFPLRSRCAVKGASLGRRLCCTPFISRPFLNPPASPGEGLLFIFRLVVPCSVSRPGYGVRGPGLPFRRRRAVGFPPDTHSAALSMPSGSGRGLAGVFPPARA